MKANFLLQKITLTNRLFHISRDIHISYNVTISGGQDQMSEGGVASQTSFDSHTAGGNQKLHC